MAREFMEVDTLESIFGNHYTMEALNFEFEI